MLIYNGVQITKKELDKIDNYANKIARLSPICYDVVVNLTEQAAAKLKISVSTFYCGKKVMATALGDEKISLMKEATDDIIRQIRKIKTQKEGSRESIRLISQDETNIPVQESKSSFYDVKHNIKKKKIHVKNLSDEGAIDHLESEGLNFLVYYSDGLRIITRNSDKEYVSFEVCDS